MTARLILICHASTAAVRKAAFPADEPLDEYGKAAAAALAGSLPRADQCWTGSELRTRQTAEALGLKANPLPMLRDCDYGKWKGRTFNEICEQEPDAIALWLRDPAAAPHGGESILAVMQRIATWLDSELADNQQSIVVTHSAVIRAAIVHAIDAKPQSFWRIDIAPLSRTRLSGTEGRWNLVSMEGKASGGGQTD